jgi:hypothetical protein
MVLGPWPNVVLISRFGKKHIFGDEERERFSSKRQRDAPWRMICGSQIFRTCEGTSRFD